MKCFIPRSLHPVKSEFALRLMMVTWTISQQHFPFWKNTRFPPLSILFQKELSMTTLLFGLICLIFQLTMIHSNSEITVLIVETDNFVVPNLMRSELPII